MKKNKKSSSSSRKGKRTVYGAGVSFTNGDLSLINNKKPSSLAAIYIDNFEKMEGGGGKEDGLLNSRGCRVCLWITLILLVLGIIGSVGAVIVLLAMNKG